MTGTIHTHQKNTDDDTSLGERYYTTILRTTGSNPPSHLENTERRALPLRDGAETRRRSSFSEPSGYALRSVLMCKHASASLIVVGGRPASRRAGVLSCLAGADGALAFLGARRTLGWRRGSCKKTQCPRHLISGGYRTARTSVIIRTAHRQWSVLYRPETRPCDLPSFKQRGSTPPRAAGVGGRS